MIINILASGPTIMSPGGPYRTLLIERLWENAEQSEYCVGQQREPGDINNIGLGQTERFGVPPYSTTVETKEVFLSAFACFQLRTQRDVNLFSQALYGQNEINWWIGANELS